MTPLAILAAAVVLTVLVLATCAIVAIRRWWDRAQARQSAASRRIIDLRGRIMDGEFGQAGLRVPHDRRFTLHPTSAASGNDRHNSRDQGTQING